MEKETDQENQMEKNLVRMLSGLSSKKFVLVILAREGASGDSVSEFEEF